MAGRTTKDHGAFGEGEQVAASTLAWHPNATLLLEASNKLSIYLFFNMYMLPLIIVRETSRLLRLLTDHSGPAWCLVRRSWK